MDIDDAINNKSQGLKILSADFNETLNQSDRQTTKKQE